MRKTQLKHVISQLTFSQRNNCTNKTILLHALRDQDIGQRFITRHIFPILVNLLKSMFWARCAGSVVDSVLRGFVYLTLAGNVRYGWLFGTHRAAVFCRRWFCWLLEAAPARLVPFLVLLQFVKDNSTTQKRRGVLLFHQPVFTLEGNQLSINKSSHQPSSG